MNIAPPAPDDDGANQRAERFEEYLRLLNVKSVYRRLLVMRLGRGLNTREMATHLNRTEDATRRLLSRAIHAWCSLLRDNDGGAQHLSRV
jgi:DNA-directed RNA polymerase specialized sigma24 family protein